MRDSLPKLLSRKDAADHLGVSIVTVARYIKTGRLDGRKIGVGRTGRVMITVDSVRQLIESGSRGGADARAKDGQ